MKVELCSFTSLLNSLLLSLAWPHSVVFLRVLTLLWWCGCIHWRSRALRSYLVVWLYPSDPLAYWLQLDYLKWLKTHFKTHSFSSHFLPVHALLLFMCMLVWNHEVSHQLRTPYLDLEHLGRFLRTWWDGPHHQPPPCQVGWVSTIIPLYDSSQVRPNEQGCGCSF